MSDDLPEHWHHHGTSIQAPCVGLGADMLEEDAGIGNPADEYYIQLCGGCGHELAAFHSGYTPADHGEKTEGGKLAETLCPNCLNANFRHATVVATRGFVNERGNPDQWRVRYLQNRADRRFWRGKLATSAAGMRAGDEPLFGRKHNLDVVDVDWVPRCPLCGERHDRGEEFDFHHWDYENDKGCMLCRDCHTHVHGGQTATEQAQENGSDWVPDAINRLVERASENGLEFTDAYDIQYRFNIPLTDRTAEEFDRIEAEVIGP